MHRSEADFVSIVGFYLQGRSICNGDEDRYFRGTKDDRSIVWDQQSGESNNMIRFLEEGLLERPTQDWLKWTYTRLAEIEITC